jgi:hypothetical protein
VSEELFDLFFNPRSGYRAQICAGEEIGELFNAHVVEAIAPMLIESANLYTEYVYRELCELSFTASHTRVWFPKEMNSPKYENQLLLLLGFELVGHAVDPNPDRSDRGWSSPTRRPYQQTGEST